MLSVFLLVEIIVTCLLLGAIALGFFPPRWW